MRPPRRERARQDRRSGATAESGQEGPIAPAFVCFTDAHRRPLAHQLAGRRPADVPCRFKDDLAAPPDGRSRRRLARGALGDGRPWGGRQRFGGPPARAPLRRRRFVRGLVRGALGLVLSPATGASPFEHEGACFHPAGEPPAELRADQREARVRSGRRNAASHALVRAHVALVVVRFCGAESVVDARRHSRLMIERNRFLTLSFSSRHGLINRPARRRQAVAFETVYVHGRRGMGGERAAAR